MKIRALRSFSAWPQKQQQPPFLRHRVQSSEVLLLASFLSLVVLVECSRLPKIQTLHSNYSAVRLDVGGLLLLDGYGPRFFLELTDAAVQEMIEHFMRAGLEAK